MKRQEPTEDVEQTMLFRWAEMERNMYPELRMMFHVPNGGQRNAIVAAKLKAQGVKPGVPDIVLPVARSGKHGLFIELKREKSGTVSEKQKRWIAELQAEGYEACVCHGFDEAREKIIAYLYGGRQHG